MPKRKDPFLTDGLSLTFQTRLDTSVAQDAALSVIARLMSSIERQLYVQCRKGRSLASLKNETLARHQIPARYFNAAKASLEGKVRSVMTNLKNAEASYDRRTKAKIKQIKTRQTRLGREKDPGKHPRLRFGLHQSKRRLATLGARQARIQQRLGDGNPAICFGSKALFQKQFQLEENGYHSHGDWRAARQS